MERIYIDTNILVYWLFPKNTLTAKPSADFLKDVEDGKYIGVISYLTINELFKSIRGMLVKDGKTSITLWKAKEKEAMRKIFALSSKFVEIVSGKKDDCKAIQDDLAFGKISDDAFLIMDKYPGQVTKNKHDGLSTIDTYHVVLAKLFDCNKIASIDNDFKECSNEIPPLSVKEVYPI